VESRRQNRIPLIPGKLAGAEEASESGAERCINVDVVIREELGAELGRNFEEDVFCEGKAVPVGVLVIDPFGALEDTFDDRVVEFWVLVFQVVVLDCIEVTFSSFDFDSFDDVGEPMCD